MSKWAADMLESFDEFMHSRNFRGLKICKVKAINPLVLTYNDIDISTSEGDKIYVHPLFVGVPINQDTKTLLNPQNFKSTTAYNSPEFQGAIEGSLPDFIKEFYTFYKNWQAKYLLKAGDRVAVFELGENSFLILQKITLDKLPEKSEENKK